MWSKKITKKAAASSEALVLPVEEPPLTKRRLKKETSDASLNSRGMPSCFDTPESTEAAMNCPLTKGASSSSSKPKLFPQKKARPRTIGFGRKANGNQRKFEGAAGLKTKTIPAKKPL